MLLDVDELLLDKLAKAVETYLEQVLGEVSRVDEFSRAAALPFYLQDRYLFGKLAIAGTPCVLMLARNEVQDTPAVVRKHLQAVRQEVTEPVVYVVERLSSYNRKRLIEQRVPFVVPNKQMYLPMLGIDLREQFSLPADDGDNPLGAVAQVLLLRELFQTGASASTAGELAESLEYSAMTIGRAFAELADRRLAEVERIGRGKHLVFAHRGLAMWEQVKKHLNSPVRKSIWVEDINGDIPAPAAGGTALAHYTTLGEPRYRVIAINAREWPGQKELLHLNELPHRADHELQVELWRYNPRLIKEGACVDELSLWLSVKDSEDERVAMAADELLGEMKW